MPLPSPDRSSAAVSSFGGVSAIAGPKVPAGARSAASAGLGSSNPACHTIIRLPSAANWASPGNPVAFAGGAAREKAPPFGATATFTKLPAPPFPQAANATPRGSIAAIGNPNSNSGVESGTGAPKSPSGSARAASTKLSNPLYRRHTSRALPTGATASWIPITPLADTVSIEPKSPPAGRRAACTIPPTFVVQAAIAVPPAVNPTLGDSAPEVVISC